MILCAAARCRALGRHKADCTDECRGCLPRPAADGRNLCEVCTRRLGEDAVQAARLYRELEHVLATSSGRGEKTSGSKERGLRVNERALECRTLIRHTLVSWCLLVCEERGIGAPRDTVTAMGAYLEKHQEWLSAHPAADDCAGELSELAHGKARRAAYPNPVEVAEVGPCPIRGCAGLLTAVFRQGDSLLPSTVECGWWAGLPAEERDMAPHIWTAGDWRGLKRLFAEKKEREDPENHRRAQLAAEAETGDRVAV